MRNFQVYIAEISSARLRGALGNINQVSINLGFVIAYFVGYYMFSYSTLVPIIITFLNVVLMGFFLPETPRWLLANNRRHDAILALYWLRGTTCRNSVEEECFEIETTVNFGESLRLLFAQKTSIPSGQNRQKNSLKECVKECVFVNSALKIQCHVVKYTLLQTAFSAILLTGRSVLRTGKPFTRTPFRLHRRGGSTTLIKPIKFLSMYNYCYFGNEKLFRKYLVKSR